MSDTANYNQKIRELVGAKGFVALSKAIVALPDMNTDCINDYLKQLQIIPRGVSFWLSKSLNLLPNGNNISLKIPTTELTLTVNRNVNNKFSGILLEKSEQILEFQEQDLPRVIALCLAAHNLFDENHIQYDKAINKSLQRIVNLLVDNHFFKHDVSEIKLQKNHHTVACPDCQEIIKLTPEHKKLCICYKFLGKNSLHIYQDKNDTLKVVFGSRWDKDNIALLLKAFQKQTEESHG